VVLAVPILAYAMLDTTIATALILNQFASHLCVQQVAGVRWQT
jgi:hypothetical protein